MEDLGKNKILRKKHKLLVFPGVLKAKQRLANIVYQVKDKYAGYFAYVTSCPLESVNNQLEQFTVKYRYIPCFK